jgi:hypothetical protein
MILDEGEIVGFVEVKPSNASYLRPGQERFKRFCERYGIPFAKWSPDEPIAHLKSYQPPHRPSR